MASLLHRLGRFAHRRRIAVVLAWLAVLVAVAIGAGTLAGKTSTTLEIPGQESTTALDLIDQRFGPAAGTGGSGGTAKVVLAAPEGAAITDPAVAQQVEGVVQQLGALPGVESASDPFAKAAPTVSPDRQAAYSTVTYDRPAGEVTDGQRAALEDVLAGARADGLTAEVSGDATRPVAEVLGPTELVGVLVAFLVLALTYGTLVAAGMNLLTAVVGVGIGALSITTLTGFVDLQSTTSILAVMLGLAVGIDYALFIFTRFRGELRAGRDVPEAVATAVGTAGSAVVTAGLTVVIALAGLAVAGIPFLTEMGLAAAGTVVVAVLVATTLVPAVLALLGHRVLPRRARTRAGAVPPTRRDRFYRRWVEAVTRRRAVALVVTVLALAVVAIPFLSMRTSLNQQPDPGSTQGRATALVAEHFGPGVNGPLVVLVDGEGAVPAAQQVRSLAGDLPDVAAVTPAQPNADGSAALVSVVPESAPDSQATVDLVNRLRDALGSLGGAEGTGGPDVYVTGQTAVSVDVGEQLSSALPVYLVVVVGLALVLLLLVFRSVLVPVVAVLGFLLTVSASFGATTAVFQWGWLAGLLGVDSTGPLLSLMPLLVVGILFGLAMDYQVFLVSRMHEAHAHGASPRDAVVGGFRQAAPVVVAAAAIMFAVFAGFVPSDDATIKAIAFALAVGILVDAFLVRMVVVPAALSLAGDAAWWLPSWLRWLPELDVEGAALEESRTPEPAARS